MTNPLNEFSAAETDQLIAELLDEIPRFIGELSDKKVLENIYSAMRWYENDNGYRWHRFKHHLFHGTQPTVQSPPYSGIQFTEAKQYHAALMGMICVMEEIFTAVCTVYHPSAGRYHYFGLSNLIVERIEAVVEKRLYSPESDLGGEAAFDELSELYEQQIDLFEFMVFVFRFLRDGGYNWRYRSDHLDFVKRMEEGRVGHANNDDKDEDRVNPEWLTPAEVDAEELAPDAEQYNRNHLSDLTFESEYFKFVADEPEAVVQAYVKVYGVEPEGYPPRMDEY